MIDDPDAKLLDHALDRLERAVVGAACAVGACVIAASLTEQWTTETPQGIRKIVDTSVQLAAELLGAISRLGHQEGNNDASPSD